MTRKEIEDIIVNMRNEFPFRISEAPLMFCENLSVTIYNKAIDDAIENAGVRWIESPKLSDPDHETAIIDEESLLQLKIK
jgi:hypothetical protein